MDLATCRKCGKLFNYIHGERLCPNCIKETEEKFKQVKKYVYDNPTAGIDKISQDNDVSVRQIKKWVREERLVFSEDSPIGIECEMCGQTIKTGRYCMDCATKIRKGLAMPRPSREMDIPAPNTRENRMRFMKN